MENLYFALDVGTRTVIGVVLEKKNNKFHILGAEVEEHNTRAMLDGQIHDIPAVTSVIKNIKNKLEKKLKTKLNSVSVAAAGRALYTQKAITAKEVSPEKAIEEEQIQSLVMAGVQEAQRLVCENTIHNKYYCVGYSVIKYFLDSSEIKNLLGQRGKEIKVEVVATFLPRVVIDSLNSVISQAGLKINNMTLEPIAASNVVISEGMRKLNLALIDVGAGTSDIAISMNGSISAYAMVPAAGDEITEAISEKYLVDFSTAESIKRNLHKEYITYEDVLGMKVKVKSSEIIDSISSAVENLAKKIAEEIILLNAKTPQAVILIGGGSLTPLLKEKLAEKLDLIPERVAVRGREVLSDVTGAPKTLSGPMSITPLGIALTEARGIRSNFEYIVLNGELVRIFGREKLKVLDVLLAAGIKNYEIFPKPGRGITIEINGKIKIIQGEAGIPSQVKINNKKVSLDYEISKGDEIFFKPAQKGKDAKALVKDILPSEVEKVIILNGKKTYLKPVVYLNNTKARYYMPLKDNDIIQIKSIDSIRDLIEHYNYNESEIKEIIQNGTSINLDAPVKNGDKIDFVFNKNELESNNETLNIQTEKIEVSVNGEKIFLEKNDSLMLLDIFKEIDFSPTPPIDKKRLVLEVNQVEANYTTTIKEGDEIQIYWSD